MAKAESLSNKFSGMILLQVESKGEAWYINPTDQSRCYLGKQEDAYKIMRELGLGIKHDTLTKYLKNGFPKNLSGKILLDVEGKGEAYYVYPKDNKGYYLGKQADAYKIMREKGMGISDSNLNKIKINKKYDNTNNPYLIDLSKNQKWSISLKVPQIDDTAEMYHYITILRDGENITSKTSDIDKDTGQLKESLIYNYSPSYSYKIDYLGINKDQTVNYSEGEYVKLYSDWYDYPALQVGHNSISYYIPLNISSKKIKVIRESYSEYGKTKNYSNEVTAEITSLEKSNLNSSCSIKGQTKSTGKFYYTKTSSKSKYLEYFKCFDSEILAQQDGYTKSLNN
jgi:hypothetical protein